MHGTITLYQKPGSRGVASGAAGFVKEFVIKPGDTAALAAAVEYDNCPACYRGGYRSGANFVAANAILADIDNTHTDDPNRWITHNVVAARLNGVEHYHYPSRNHMKAKGDKTPRPKTHFIFPIDCVTSTVEYVAHMEWLINHLPELHFDGQVKMPAQLNFGTENPQVTYRAGSMNLTEYIRAHGGLFGPGTSNAGNSGNGTTVTANTTATAQSNSQKHTHGNNVIPEGTRNSHMSHFAARVLTKYGESKGTAYLAFLDEAEKCSPPLADTELNTIWNSASEFYRHTVATNPNYIPPAQYNAAPSISELLIADQAAFSMLCAPPAKERLFNIAVAKLFLQAYGLSLRINEMSGRADISGLPPKYGGDDAANILGILIADAANNLGYKRASRAIVHDTLSVIAAENRYHPVLDLLNAAHWDGYDRRPEIYRMLGLTDVFHMTLVYKWCIQVMAVLHNTPSNPVAAQGVLTLQGPQGTGKTEFFRHLSIRDEFIKTGATLDMSSKDSLMSALKVWITELGELDSTTKREQSALKAFLTEITDRHREPYARHETVRPRRTSFCATVNPKNFLRDTTGNRRFWTIPVGNIDTNAIFGYPPEWYTQFWRQILAEYLLNPKGYLLTAQEQDAVNGRNAEFEAEVYGEAEFMTLYDLSASTNQWAWKTAAHIANALNDSFTSLRISSEAVGQRLLPRIEQRSTNGFEFQRKRGTGGKRLILCPPIRINWEK